METAKTNLGLDENEAQMFNELVTVLNKYPLVKRKFGIMLDHSHFEITDSEIMLETNNPTSRYLLSKPINQREIPIGAFPSMWCFTKDNKITVAQVCCADDPEPPDPTTGGPFQI